jgi:TetR/AcrR family transcriptional regulator, cholesterol catabolism regulator
MKQRQTNGTGVNRRDEIIRAAEKIFAEKGYQATTLDEIAREIGITKASLYYYIKSKTEILQSIVNRMIEPMEAVARTGRSPGSPKERLEKMIRQLVEFGAERKEITRIVFEQGNVLPKRTRDAINRRREEVDKVIRDTLKEGMEQGIFHFDDAKITSFAIVAIANGLYRWYQNTGKRDPNYISREFINLLEKGLLNNKPHKRSAG